MMNERCSELVWDSRGWHKYQCNKHAVVMREGKPYCRIHDPIYIKQKEDKRKEEYEANSCKGCGYHFTNNYYKYCPLCGSKRINGGI